MWFTPSSKRSESGSGDARSVPAATAGRDRDRPDRRPDRRSSGPVLPPVAVREDDPDRLATPVELRPAADPHGGRRGERRRAERVSRADRESSVLCALGLFRVVSRKAIVADCFDGHPFAAGRTLASLEKRGIIVKRRVARGKRGYFVFSLSAHGRDLLAQQRAAADAEELSRSGEQRYWAAGGDDRQLRHDHHVYDAVRADVSDAVSRGSRVVRVRLESELRGRLAAAEAIGRRAGGPDRAKEARRREALHVGLHVFVDGAPLPDALVELEHPDGKRVVRAVEVASGHYSPAQLREKREAGFRLYGIPHFRTDGRRQRRGPLNRDDPFPLSWGGGR